jgi:hypothetical protein
MLNYSPDDRASIDEAIRPEFEAWAIEKFNMQEKRDMLKRSTVPGYEASYRDQAIQYCWNGWRGAYQAGAKAEREMCAKLCETKIERPAGFGGSWGGYGNFMGYMDGKECAVLIRSRG